MMEIFTQLSLKEYLEKLSSSEPVPGGGSVSAYTGAMAIGLMQMVARIRLARKLKEEPPEEKEKDLKERKHMEQAIQALEKIKQDVFQIVDLDPKIYKELLQAWKKEEAREEALHNAFRLQADLALLLVRAKGWNLRMGQWVRGAIQNDLKVSRALLDGAFQGAYATALVNVQCMKDEKAKGRALEALEALQEKFEKGLEPVGTTNGS